MKTLLISYIIGLNLLVYIFLPDVAARPLEVIPRLAIYLAFPLAVFISTLVVILQSLLESNYSKKVIKDQKGYLQIKPSYSLI